MPSFRRRSQQRAGHHDGDRPPSGGDGTKRFDYLASALAGRPLSVISSTTSPSYTDGAMVFLAQSEPGEGIGPDDLCTVCVQATLVGIGSLDAAPIREIKAHPEVGRRFITLEARRALALRDNVLPPGVIARIRATWDDEPPTDAQASAQQAISDLSVPEAPPSFGSIVPRVLRSVVAAPSPATALADRSSDAESEPDEENAEDEDRSPRHKSSVIVQAPFDNPMTRLMQKLLGGKSRPDEDAGGGDSGVKSAIAPKTPPSDRARVVPGSPPRTFARVPKALGVAYPEWDFRRGAYREDWCRVVRLDPAPRALDSEPARRKDRQLSRAIARLTLAYERHNREVSGDSLDLPALVDFQVSRVMGSSPDADVFQARRRTANDLSVLVLLDCSGSGAETSGGTPIWEQQRSVAAELVRAFEQAGSRVAFHGFNSYGRQVRFLRVKTFNDRFGPKASQRLMALQPAGFTRMGAAIRHARAVLNRQGGSDRKLLVVISDGFPYDDDYEGEYAEHDACRALEEARSDGVGCACFAVGSGTTDAALDRLWGSATHARLSSGPRWSHPIEPTLRQALLAASGVH